MSMHEAESPKSPVTVESVPEPISRRRLAIIAVILVLLTAASFLFPVREWTEAIRQWVTGLGHWGIAAFLCIYVVWTMTTMPAIPLAIMAGILFGPWRGFAVSLSGATIGTSVTFFIGRCVGRGVFMKLMERHHFLRRIDAMIERQSLLVITFLRLVPVFPVNLLNYGLGSSSMRFRVYFLASFLLTIPGSAMYAGVGDALNQAWSKGHISHATVTTLVVLALASAGLALIAKKKFTAVRQSAE